MCQPLTTNSHIRYNCDRHGRPLLSPQAGHLQVTKDTGSKWQVAGYLQRATCHLSPKQVEMLLRDSWFTLVRFAFRLLYNEMAWTYGPVSWGVSLGQWRQWQLAALPFVQGRRVLELGHGPGHMLLALQNRGFDVVGLDLSPYMGQQAQKRTQRTVPLVQGMVQNLPFGTAVFDTILATFPTDYIIDPRTLAAAHRVLRGHGRLVIVPEGHLNGQGHIYRLIDWLYTITGQREGVFTENDGHIWPADALWEPIRQRFAAAGFALTIKRIQLPHSGVTVLVAVKV